ncbi:Stp1/IreP family PP2C-type Ser/Thr phosphatase [Marinitenerispora sediminis]|uniref:Serine/threonine protein phosphatase PstP n=1 Tax=Marinitenerispora sediminis TaxID=1931232 RepID=A0A368T3E1_9ACTN|nr:Stp1/IreP family PP2C-type Ser/Thr phosphatase [Marinitenerispora sediminis]RCV50951.1 Stp1/IreP family PP2C-type Ser/Thr phosphatase [Marinitenerispora sediminis]RCV56346.1 Stp1/IreP family PP2C-type Ser/Thr phosphatase [Marinitenerispora sediminis]RCV60414.1 Stp1/IreP family PP2C-type Ser/Thr phosphatase [Marinitenerispora sediminis]
MTIALRYAAYSDVGCLREGNEDSAYAGPYLLAVADGMGGHAGGEIASAIAIATLMPLDDDVPGNEMVASLEQAVEQANGRLSQRVREEPRLENMGTTLTAMLWSGARMALIHIGDSRAYLLRGGEFSQITHDHTLVQTLVDEGKITEDEVATHPQRSLLLRALDGRSQVDPDVSVREAQVGDRYLLCSDGLSGVVSPETIRETLAGEANVDAAARRLIDLANRGGGPDNITAVVADVIDTATDPKGPTAAPAVVGAADQRREPLMTPDTPAGRAQGLARGSGDTAEMDRIPAASPDDDEPQPATKKWWPMVLTFLVIVALVAGAGFYFGQRYLNSQYFIGPSGDETNVAVYQGINTDIAGYSLAEQVEDTGIRLDLLPENERSAVTATIPLDSREQADSRVADLREKAQACEADPASCGMQSTSGASGPTDRQRDEEPAGQPAGGQVQPGAPDSTTGVPPAGDPVEPNGGQ